VDRLAAVGFDARYGARPLQRAVEREVAAPLARWLLGQGERAGRLVDPDWGDGGVVFRGS